VPPRRPAPPASSRLTGLRAGSRAWPTVRCLARHDAADAAPVISQRCRPRPDRLFEPRLGAQVLPAQARPPAAVSPQVLLGCWRIAASSARVSVCRMCCARPLAVAGAREREGIEGRQPVPHGPGADAVAEHQRRARHEVQQGRRAVGGSGRPKNRSPRHAGGVLVDQQGQRLPVLEDGDEAATSASCLGSRGSR